MEKERIILFGAGGIGKKLYEEYNAQNEFEVIAFADNFKTGHLYGLPILKPEELFNVDYDSIIITTVAAEIVKKQLLEMGIKSSKIIQSSAGVLGTARDVFLKRFAEEVIRISLKGDVAEAGVFQGDFAALINEYFPEKKLYLFDTFEGFDARDTEIEEGFEKDPQRGIHFKNTSLELVLGKMKFPENCVIRKGYVPETLHGLEEKRFCFVNLDMDLYQPTLTALEWFWPRMIEGGVILIHDYFDETDTYPNLKKAVIKFTSRNNIFSLPIGDNLSIALLKK